MYTHSMIEKHCMFEMASRVPLIISYPKSLPSGVRCSGLVSMLDILPAILDLTAQPVPTSYEGVSLVTTLDGKASPERTVFSEFYEANKQSYKMFPGATDLPMRMCRYKCFKYVYTHGFIEQLYNLNNDPNEMNNLVLTGSEQNKLILEKLRLATFNGWMVDERPLFDVSMNRNGRSLEFTWNALPETKEYILYRGETEDPLKAVEAGRSSTPSIADTTSLKPSEAYYWVVAVPQLERMDEGSILYQGVAVATNTLAPNLPASRRMRVYPTDQNVRFMYEKQNIYH